MMCTASEDGPPGSNQGVRKEGVLKMEVHQAQRRRLVHSIPISFRYSGVRVEKRSWPAALGGETIGALRHFQE